MDDETEESIKAYQIHQNLGHGAFGNVYLAIKNGENFAIKVIV